jgi:hypothetical protein
MTDGNKVILKVDLSVFMAHIVCRLTAARTPVSVSKMLQLSEYLWLYPMFTATPRTPLAVLEMYCSR